MYYVFACNNDDNCDAKFQIGEAKTLNEALNIAVSYPRDAYIYYNNVLVAFKRDNRVNILANEILGVASKILVVGCWISRSKLDYGMWRRFRVYALMPTTELIEITPKMIGDGEKRDYWECKTLGTDRVKEIIHYIARKLGIQATELEEKTVFLSPLCN